MEAIRIRRKYKQFVETRAVNELYLDINFTAITVAANGKISSLMPFVLRLTFNLRAGRLRSMWMPIFIHHQVCRSYFSFEHQTVQRKKQQFNTVPALFNSNWTLNITVIISAALENTYLVCVCWNVVCESFQPRNGSWYVPERSCEKHYLDRNSTGKTDTIQIFIKIYCSELFSLPLTASKLFYFMWASVYVWHSAECIGCLWLVCALKFPSSGFE